MEEALKIVEILILGSAGVIIGIFEGLSKCIFSYFKGFSYSFHRAYSIKAKAKVGEPAVEKYFFYKQYEDLQNTYSSAVSINTGNILMLKQQLREDSCFIYGRVKAAQAMINVFGTILNVMWFSIHLIVITIISAPIYLFYLIVVSIEKIKFLKGKISGICPHCHGKYTIPYYICPRCKRIHKVLKPGAYGIIRRKCKCGEIIPSTSFSGRSRLSALCPLCHESIEGRESSPICIPIVGGPSVGKTCFMCSAMSVLINDISKEKKWNIGFLSEDKKEKLEGLLELFKKGNIPEKTKKEETEPYNIFISSNRFFSEKLLYIYDIAGEYFDSRTGIRKQRYYEYANGLIIIIDPLALKDKAKTINIKDEPINCNCSNTNVEDFIDRFILAFREIKEVKLNKLIDIPVAIVVNKMDLFDYKNDVVDFLKELGGEKIIRKFEHNFGNYKFFSCSTLEYTANGISYGKKEVYEVVKWILSQSNRELG